jgi:hypothetical protein
MGKKPKEPTPTPHREIWMESMDSPPFDWTGIYIMYEGDQALWRIDAIASDAHKLLSLLLSASIRLQSYLAAGQLTLPDMGDWQYQYFGTR